MARLQRQDFSPEQVAWSFSSHSTPSVLITHFTYCCLWCKGFHPEGRQLQWLGRQKRSDQSCGRSCSLKHSVCTNEVQQMTIIGDNCVHVYKRYVTWHFFNFIFLIAIYFVYQLAKHAVPIPCWWRCHAIDMHFSYTAYRPPRLHETSHVNNNGQHT